MHTGIDAYSAANSNFYEHFLLCGSLRSSQSLVYSTLFANATHKVFLLVNRNAFDAEPLELSLPCRFDARASASSSFSSNNNNYTKIEHANCYSFHGADDLESPEGNAAALGVSLEECTKLCDDTDGCDAVTFGKVWRVCARSEATKRCKYCAFSACYPLDLSLRYSSLRLSRRLASLVACNVLTL